MIACGAKKIVVFGCFDVGSANVVSALMQAWMGSDAEMASCYEMISIVGGPALAIFVSLGIRIDFEVTAGSSEVEIFSWLESVGPSAVITGTSYDSMLERNLIHFANLKELISISLIDWWSSYALRFSTPATLDLKYVPRYVAVSDEFASGGAIKERIDSNRIRITGNPYWDSLQSFYTGSKKCEIKQRVRRSLGISDDAMVISVILGNARHYDLGLGCDEKDLLTALLPIREHDSSGRKVVWLGLKHPSESWESFEKFVHSIAPTILLPRDIPSLDSIVASDGAVGIISTLQFEAVLLDRSVLCLAPNGKLDKMPFIQVFKAIGIKTILNEESCRNAIDDFLDQACHGRQQLQMPRSIIDGTASKNIFHLLEGEFKD